MLIAEMDLGRARQIARVLTSGGLEAVIARSGDRVLALLQGANPPLLLVFNLGIARLDGLSVLLRAAEADALVPVIALTDTAALRDAVLDMALPHARVLSTHASGNDIQAAGVELLKRAPHRKVSRPRADADEEPNYDWLQPALDELAHDVVVQFDVLCAFATVEVGGRLWCGIRIGALDRPLPADRSPMRWPMIGDAVASRELLIIPDREAHPVFRSAEWPLMSSFRGLAIMPMTPEGGALLGAVVLVCAESMALSADDLLRFRTVVLAAATEIDRMLSTSQVSDRLRHIERELEGTRETAAVKIAALRELSLKDPLTALANRRGGDDALAREAARIGRTNGHSAIVLFDIDNFKTINDTFGHAAGDDMLRAVAGTLTQHLRAGDLAARWGGEEFFIMLPDQTAEGALVFAERLRRAVEGLDVAGMRTTVSGGVAELVPQQPHSEALARADAALYAAKSAGRNCIR